MFYYPIIKKIKDLTNNVYQRILRKKQPQLTMPLRSLSNVKYDQKDGYSAFVRRSTIITDYGVLKFTTSALWVAFDHDGNFIRSTPTP